MISSTIDVPPPRTVRPAPAGSARERARAERPRRTMPQAPLGYSHLAPFPRSGLAAPRHASALLRGLAWESNLQPRSKGLARQSLVTPEGRGHCWPPNTRARPLERDCRRNDAMIRDYINL